MRHRQTTDTPTAASRLPRRLAALLLLAALPLGTLTACQTADEAALAPTVITPAYKDAREALFNAPDRFAYPDAIAALEAVVAAEPANSAARVDLAYAHLKRGKTDDAREALARVDPSALNRRKRLRFEALEAKVADRRADEVAAWTRLTDRHPEDRWAWYELASAESARENYAEAARAAERAWEAEPDPARWESSWLPYLQSKALYRSGDDRGAMEAAERGRTTPTTWRSTWFRGELARLRSGEAGADPDTSAKQYIDISEAEGRNNTSYTHANLALFFHELGDLDRAERYARTAHAEEPEGYQSWALVFILADNGKADEAVRVADAALLEHSDNDYLHAARGWALLQAGRVEEAGEAFRHADELEEKSNPALESLARQVERAAEEPGYTPPRIPWLG